MRQFPQTRLRRIRTSPFLRDLTQEQRLRVTDLIYPMFILNKGRSREAIAAMPGIERIPVDQLEPSIEKIVSLGIPAVAIFPVIEQNDKSEHAEEAYNSVGLTQTAVRKIKELAPQLGVITDVALDPYTLHGQDGVLDKNAYVDNDRTLEILVRQAVSHAEAGADIVAPSDMMDGRIGAIRAELEAHKYPTTAILAYSAKYASAFYGPFREAVGSATNLAAADKKSYQMNPANGDEARHEAALDISEGADMIMVKPGIPYLDIVYRLKQQFSMPTFVYHVSGEYSMLKAAAQSGYLDEKKAVLETLLGCKRAGADAILTYYAIEVAQWLQTEN